MEFLLIKPQAMARPMTSFWPLAIKIKDRPRMLSLRGPVSLDPKIINCDLTEPFSSAVTAPKLPISFASIAFFVNCGLYDQMVARYYLLTGHDNPQPNKFSGCKY